MIPGKAPVTSVRKVLFSHLRMSQQCLSEATVGSREDSAAAWRACSARNMRWIHTRASRVRSEKAARAYRQCGPRRPHTNCSRACFLERRSGGEHGLYYYICLLGYKAQTQQREKLEVCFFERPNLRNCFTNLIKCFSDRQPI